MEGVRKVCGTTENVVCVCVCVCVCVSESCVPACVQAGGRAGGCVDVWVCGCVGVWVCGCVGAWVWRRSRRGASVSPTYNARLPRPTRVNVDEGKESSVLPLLEQAESGCTPENAPHNRPSRSRCRCTTTLRFDPQARPLPASLNWPSPPRETFRGRLEQAVGLPKTGLHLWLVLALGCEGDAQHDSLRWPIPATTSCCCHTDTP